MDKPKLSSPVDIGEELVVIPRGTLQKLKFTWTRLRGNSPSFFNIRQWHRGDDDQWYPTPKRGLGIGVSELPGLFKAVALAAEKALEEGAGNGDPKLSKEIRATVNASRSNGVSEPLDTKTRLDTPVRHEGLDTHKTVHIEGWTVRADRRGFLRGYRKIQGVQRCVYLGKTLDGAEEKLLAANEKWMQQA